MIQELKNRTRFQNPKLAKCYAKFASLINELRNKELSKDVTDQINKELEIINGNYDEKELKKLVQKKQLKILSLIEKEHKIVPKGHYKSRWMAIGMSVFGIPIGIALGAAIDNMAFMAVFMPVGMVIGMSIGAQKDAEAAKNGKQLDFQWG